MSIKRSTSAAASSATAKASKPASRKAVSKTVGKNVEAKAASSRVKKAVSKKAATRKDVAKKPGAPSRPKKAPAVSLAPSLQPQSEKSVQEKLDTPRIHVPVPSSAPFHLDVDEGMDPGFLPSDEVMDETDYAQHMQLKEQASISHRARELNRPETHPDFDGVSCVECGEDIPPARLALKRVRCVDCQTFLEEAEARRRRTSA